MTRPESNRFCGPWRHAGQSKVLDKARPWISLKQKLRPFAETVPSHAGSQKCKNLFVIHGRDQPIVAFDEFGHLHGPMGKAGLFCTIDGPIIDYYYCRAKLFDFVDLDLLPARRLSHVVNVEQRLEGRASSDEIQTW